MKAKKEDILKSLMKAKKDLTINELIVFIKEEGFELPQRRTIQRALKGNPSVSTKKIPGSNELSFSFNEIEDNRLAQASFGKTQDLDEFISNKSVEYVRKHNTRTRPKARYNKALLESYRPNESLFLTKTGRDKLHELVGEIKDVLPAGTYAKDIMDKMLIDISFNSSRLEENKYSLLDTEKLIKEQKENKNLSKEETLMILNHKDAIGLLIEMSDTESLSAIDIRQLHAMLSDNLLPNSADSGRMRTGSVTISGSTYTPLEANQVLEEQFNLMAIKGARIVDPFEKSFFYLLMISYLQYFYDVNKRTARIVCNHPFVRTNLPPISLSGIDRLDYLTALLCFYETNDSKPMEILFINAYTNSIELYGYTKAGMGYIDPIKIKYRSQRRAIIGDIISNEIIEKDEQKYIVNYANNEIEKDDRDKFVSGVLAELSQVHEGKLGGYRVTVHQFESWKNSR